MTTDNKQSVLTVGQILAMDCRSDMTNDEAIRFARAVESAVLSKLRGVGEPSDDEVEQMKGDMLLLDRELQRENRRAREFSVALAALAAGIYQHRERLLAEHGPDGVPAELHRLGEQAKQAAELMDEPRNADRVAALYQRMRAYAQPATANDGEATNG